jgi:RNA polymerase sigma factor (sigma-70 family)
MKPTQSSSIFTSFNQAPGYVFITDNRAKILYTNEAILNRTGYNPAEAIGKNPGKLWGGNMPNSFYQKLWESLALKHQAFSSFAENKRKNGAIYSEHIHILPIFEKNQELTYFLAFQPLLNNTSDQEKFSEIFKKSPQIAQEDPNFFFDFLGQSIQATKKISEEKFSETVSDILLKEFIAPTEQKYSARFRDTQLIQKAQNNSEQFAELYLTYRDTITQYFLKHLSYNQSLAEDLSQETSINAFSHLSKFSSSNASYQTYLLRIAHNILVNHFRKTVFSSLNNQVLEQIPAPNNQIDLIDKIKLQKSLARLKSDEREALNLMYSEGYSLREIAIRYEKTENAIKLMVSRARKKLQKLMS